MSGSTPLHRPDGLSDFMALGTYSRAGEEDSRPGWDGWVPMGGHVGGGTERLQGGSRETTDYLELLPGAWVFSIMCKLQRQEERSKAWELAR